MFLAISKILIAKINVFSDLSLKLLVSRVLIDLLFI